MTSWDMQLLGCFDKGVDAQRAGKPIEDCPYKQHRGLGRQRADYWRDGWTQSKEGRVYEAFSDPPPK